MDFQLKRGDYVVLGFSSNHKAASWKGPTNAKYMVPTGKKLIVLQGLTSNAVAWDNANRKCWLGNPTDAADVFGGHGFHGFGLDSSGDLATASKLPDVAAGKTVQVEIWNADTNKRAPDPYRLTARERHMLETLDQTLGEAPIRPLPRSRRQT